ncbi:STN domain-containing protein, partial [Vibrio parahaemolyticus]
MQGRLTAEQALARMLKKTGLQARRVASSTYLVEAAPAAVPRAPRAMPAAAHPPATRPAA